MYIKRDRSGLLEQAYTNTNRLYWHGSPNPKLTYLKASAKEGESVPMAWVSTSFDYAQMYAVNPRKPQQKGFMHLLRPTGKMNIWNPKSAKDWTALVKSRPSYNDQKIKTFLTDMDWFFHSNKPDPSFTRDGLLAAISVLGYDGVFNRELDVQYPALGLFKHSAAIFRVLRTYAWDIGLKKWYSPSTGEELL